MFAQESVMEIQKEREAFEAWFESQYDAHFMQFALDLDLYVDKHTQTCWEAWQAAKAQAVPEGFVILKASDVREILSNASDAMDAESPSSVFTQTGIPSTWYDHHLVAEKNILDAIKAQEPTND